MVEALLYAGGGVLGLAGLVFLVRALFADRARGRERCPKCWYDLTVAAGAAAAGESVRCTECGRVTKRSRARRHTRRHWRTAALAFVAIVAGLAVIATPKAQRDGWKSLIPTTALILALDVADTTWVMNELQPRLCAGATGQFARAHPDALAEWQWKLFARTMGREIARNPGGRGRLFTRFTFLDAPHADLAALPIAAAIEQLCGSEPVSVATMQRPMLHVETANSLMQHLGSVARESKDHAVRTAVVESLIVACIANEWMRPTAVEGLALPWPEVSRAVPMLTDLVMDDEEGERVRLIAIVSLERIGPHAADATEPLLRFLTGLETDPAIIAPALVALGAIAPASGPRLDAALEALERILRDPKQQWYVRLHAARGLRSRGACTEEVSAFWRDMVEFEPFVDAVLHEIDREPVLGANAATVLHVFEHATRDGNIAFAARLLSFRAAPFRARLVELVNDPNPVRAGEAQRLVAEIDRDR